jgi:hypothetical protein
VIDSSWSPTASPRRRTQAGISLANVWKSVSGNDWSLTDLFEVHDFCEQCRLDDDFTVLEVRYTGEGAFG